LSHKARRKNKRLRNRAIFVLFGAVGRALTDLAPAEKWLTLRFPDIIAGRIEIAAVFIWDLPPFRRIGYWLPSCRKAPLVISRRARGHFASGIGMVHPAVKRGVGLKYRPACAVNSPHSLFRPVRTWPCPRRLSRDMVRRPSGRRVRESALRI